MFAGAVRPVIEYILSEACGNANYGSRAANSLVNAGTPKYLNRENDYYKNGREGQDTDMYLVQDSTLDVLGAVSSPPPFSIAMFVHGDGEAAYVQFGTTSITGKFTAWDASCSLKLVFMIMGTIARFDYCIQNSISSTVVSKPGVLTPGKWQHVAITYDGLMLRYYVNGVYTTSLSHTFNIGTAQMYVLISFLFF